MCVIVSTRRKGKTGMTELDLNTTRTQFTVSEPQDVPHILTATLAALVEDPTSRTCVITPALWDNSEPGVRRAAGSELRDCELYVAKAHDHETVDPVAVWIPRGDRAALSRWMRVFWGGRPTRYMDSDSADNSRYRAMAYWMVSPKDHERYLTRPEQHS